MFAILQRGILFYHQSFLTSGCDFPEQKITGFDTNDTEVFNAWNEQLVFYKKWENKLGKIHGLSFVCCIALVGDI